MRNVKVQGTCLTGYMYEMCLYTFLKPEAMVTCRGRLLVGLDYLQLEIICGWILPVVGNYLRGETTCVGILFVIGDY